MKNNLSFVAALACLVISSVVSAYVVDSSPDPGTDLDPSFVPHKPQILITPDRLPILRWPELGVEPELDPSELHQLELCTPAVCTQDALDAGAAYYKVTAIGIAYYDEHGRLVGTSDQARTADGEDTSLSLQAVASASTDTEAGAPEPISAVGTTPGAFEVLLSGAATYRIPIDIPPGTAGTQPKLALVYNSQSRNGLLGVGWALEGLSAITRCPPTFTQDNRLGGIKFTSQDRFCLDGKRLVSTRGAYGAPEIEYRTEIHNFSKIISYGTQGGGPRYFKVWTKSGETLEYGVTVDSNIEAEGKDVAAEWALNEVNDSAGNYFRVTYIESPAGGEYRPSSIKYTGSTTPALEPYASVNFVYEPQRPDPTLGYRTDSRIATTLRMKSIVTRVGPTMVREYNLYYQATTADRPLSRLAHVQVCANETETGTIRCLPATDFGWQGYPSGFDPVKNTPHSTDRLHSSTRTMDVNGDGLDDLVYRHLRGTWKILLANGDGFDAEKDTGINTGNAEAAIFDHDGDGLQELAVLPEAPSTTNVRILKWNGSGFREVETNISYGARFNLDGIRAGDVDGDGRSDLIIGETNLNELVVYFNTNGSQFTRKTFGLGEIWVNSRLLDFDGDGRTDLMRFVDGS